MPLTTQQRLDKTQEQIERVLDGGVAEYIVNGRTVRRLGLDELRRTEQSLKSELNAEQSQGSKHSYTEFEPEC